MSNYFKNFPKALYRFGDEAEVKGGGDLVTEFTQDLSIYVDVIDQVRENSSFYQKYYIQNGQRPDQVSYEIYGEVDYHWTFFMMNDHLRTSGWPLSDSELAKRIKIDFPHKTITVRENLTGIFKPGEVAVGSSSGTSGIIKRRKLDLGQIIIDTKGSNFSVGEVVYTAASAQATRPVTVVSNENEYLAAHHYIDSTTRKFKDIDPATGPGANDIEVSIYDRYSEQNNELKQIRVITPSSINVITGAYRKALRS